MNGEIDLVDGELVRSRHHELMEYLGGVRSDDVSTQYLAVLRVADDLHEAFCLTGGPRPATRGERKFSDLEVELLFLALLLGEPDGGDFGMTVGGVGDIAVVHHLHVWITSEKLGQNHTFS